MNVNNMLFKNEKKLHFVKLDIFYAVYLKGCRITVYSLAKWRILEHKSSILHKSSIEELLLNLLINPPFCQTDVELNLR